MARDGAFSATDREQAGRIDSISGLAPFIAPYRGAVLLTLAVLILTVCLSLVLPLAVRRVVDGFGAGDVALLDRYFGAAMVIVGLLALGSGLRYYLVARLGERVVADIRKAVFDRVIGQSPEFYERIMTGEVLSRLTADTAVILSVVGSTVSVALRNLLILAGSVVLLLMTSAKLTGLVMLIVPVVLVPILVLGRRLRVLSRVNQDRIAESSGIASEALLAVRTVQAFTHEGPTRRAFAAATEDAFGAAKARIRTRAVMTGIVIFLIFSGVAGVLWIGARDVRAGYMSAGLLVQFVIYSVMAAGAVAALSEIWGELQRAAGATERLVWLLNAGDGIRDPQEPRVLPVPIRGEIVFDNVTFRYPSRPNSPAIGELSVTIRPGETVALVGPSGAGKSTILHLLLRFYDPEKGRVLLDGVDLTKMNRREFRRAIALVPQDPVIFGTTARENIRFGRPDAPDVDVEAAAHAAAAHDFLSALPQGYDTQVGERGLMLSAGQRQRIAIARSILRDAPVLLLDEATSALDAESERAVQEAFDRMSADRTTVIVAHRLSTIRKADRILVFDNGAVVASGTHDDLVSQGGLYARLASLQFTAGQVEEQDSRTAARG